MKEVVPSQLTERERYKLLTGAIIPRPIAWTLTKNQETGTLNLAPFSFFTVLASQIPMVTLSIFCRHGEMKDTAQNLVTTGEGVIHIVDQAHLAQMNQTAATLTPDESEIEINRLETVPAQTISTPRLVDVTVALEVKVQSHVPLNDDDGQPMTDLFMLEVVHFSFRDDLLDEDKYYVDAKGLNPISRLAGSNYGTLGDIIAVERPK